MFGFGQWRRALAAARRKRPRLLPLSKQLLFSYSHLTNQSSEGRVRVPVDSGVSGPPSLTSLLCRMRRSWPHAELGLESSDRFPDQCEHFAHFGVCFECGQCRIHISQFALKQAFLVLQAVSHRVLYLTRWLRHFAYFVHIVSSDVAAQQAGWSQPPIAPSVFRSVCLCSKVISRRRLIPQRRSASQRFFANGFHWSSDTDLSR